MDASVFDLKGIDMQWCPGCGDFKILQSLKKSLAELDLAPEDTVIVSGIGQAGKTPHFMRSHFFNGLHGRSLSNGTAIKVSNPALNVIVIGGDGDMYGEGGNQLLHTIRRNPDITNLVFNNMIYGLTKGQASPTTSQGMKTTLQVEGVINEPINPIAIAIAQNASFVARAFAGDVDKTAEIIKEAVSHKGYALVDIFQPCVSFNKVNTYQWFSDNTWYVDENHDPGDREAAFRLALINDSFPLGVLYRSEDKKTFEEWSPLYEKDNRPLYQRRPDLDKVAALVGSYR
jgi:2-oxoglutarate ferredoxin oxidoreductase subunit beta